MGPKFQREAWAELFPIRRPDIAPCFVARPSIPFGPRTVVVLGAFRGGTSMIAEMSMQAGIFLGSDFLSAAENDYECHEDTEFFGIIKQICDSGKQRESDAPEWGSLRELIATRNADHELWGFKAPSAVFLVDGLLPLLRNPHLLIVARDALSTWQGSQARLAKMPWYAVRNHVAAVLDLIERPRAPTLAISFERGKERPGEVREAIKEFLGI
jgi:hypothetical protein